MFISRSPANRYITPTRVANTPKITTRLTLVRREFDYLKALMRVVHLTHAFEVQPDLASRERLLESIDARNAFDFNPNGQAPFNRQQYGGSIGGPIKKDKTFFFLVGERFSQERSSFVNLLSDPAIFQPSASQNSCFNFLLTEGQRLDYKNAIFHFTIGGDVNTMPVLFRNLFNITPLIKVRKGKTTRIILNFDFKV